MPPLPFSTLDIALYLIAINSATFGAFFLDKRAAQRQQPRIPEKALLLLVLAGGSAGAYYAMRRFRHKTKKQSFRALFGLVVAAQGILLFLHFYRV
jgi:uncharacterized membrane protein YsdA (DUF1294 family)